MELYEKRRVCVLVKAYPQRSSKYEETVCVAGVTETGDLVRLYPVRFRHLPRERRFARFDWIEVEMTRERSDPRPESYRVKEDSIAIVIPGAKLSPEQRALTWQKAIVPSLEALKAEQKKTQRSLGIVSPDPGTMKFKFKPIAKAEPQEGALARSVYLQQQASLLEKELWKLPQPEYVFKYQFTSAGKQHDMQLHDWEVEATYHEYKRRYGSPDAALKMMTQYFQQKVPTWNAHLIMGNMHKKPWVFIIIGVLRTTANIKLATAQQHLL